MSIAVGLGIGLQTRQTLQNIDGVEQNARSAMSLEERLSIAEEHSKLSRRYIDCWIFFTLIKHILTAH